MKNNQFSLEHYQREKLALPKNQQKLLLHSCCAPCAAEIMDALKFSGIDTTIYFYNPNIHPKKEYEIRKDENKRYADKIGMEFIDADYDDEQWFKRVKGLEWEPERGERCSTCFDMRFEKTALEASEKKFNVISSTLGISRWKDMKQINFSGVKSASKYEGLTYWTFNWRKKGGSQRMLEISKNEKFYMQEYCGCIYSLRDTNKWRKKNQRETISIGKKYYGDE